MIFIMIYANASDISVLLSYVADPDANHNLDFVKRSISNIRKKNKMQTDKEKEYDVLREKCMKHVRNQIKEKNEDLLEGLVIPEEYREVIERESKMEVKRQAGIEYEKSLGLSVPKAHKGINYCTLVTPKSRRLRIGCMYDGVEGEDTLVEIKSGMKHASHDYQVCLYAKCGKFSKCELRCKTKTYYYNRTDIHLIFRKISKNIDKVLDIVEGKNEDLFFLNA